MVNVLSTILWYYLDTKDEGTLFLIFQIIISNLIKIVCKYHIVKKTECCTQEAINNIPSTITDLRVSEFAPNIWPPNITNLTIYSGEWKNVPSTVQILKFKGVWAKDKLTEYPPNLIYLSTRTPNPLVNFPENLKQLKVETNVNENFNFPSSRTKLHMHITKNNGKNKEPITFNFKNLPSTITDLLFKCDKLSPVSDPLPLSLKKCYLWDAESFTSTIFPPSITELSLHYTLSSDSLFNGPLPHLSSNLTKLYIRGYFNSSVDNLPPSLTFLSLGRNFNRPVDHLPSSLLHLDFNYPDGYCTFDQEINNLPSSLLTLSLSYFFKQSVDKLPQSLTSLNFSEQSFAHFNNPINHLPSSLLNLQLNDAFNHPIDNLPPSLTNLSIRGKFAQKIDKLPISIQKLTISGVFNQPIDHLPSKLLSLHIIGGYYNKTKFNKQLKNLPNTLQILQLPESFSKSLRHIPSSVSHVIIPSWNNTIPVTVSKVTVEDRILCRIVS